MSNKSRKQEFDDETPTSADEVFLEFQRCTDPEMREILLLILKDMVQDEDDDWRRETGMYEP